MILKEIEFENIDTSATDGWKIAPIQFDRINLVVGQNAIGKSRLVMAIRLFADMIASEGRSLPIIGIWKLTFITANNRLNYLLKIKKGSLEEEIYENDKLLLNRTNDYAKIFSVVKNEYQTIKPPRNVLALHARRDLDEYPFFEDIILWAKNIGGFKFSNVNPNYRVDILPYTIDELTSFTSTPSLLRATLDKGNNLLQSFLQVVTTEFISLGYPIEQILFKKSDYDVREDIIEIQEEKFLHPYPHYMLSQGMFRSLSLVLYINYLLLESKVSTILIDDLGEGLDYERATKLGKWLISKLEGTNIQLIATSNDSFLMDVIDIKYWNVLYREKNVIQSYNYQNSKEKFDNFRFTGLSNFDLFSSDYLLSK